MLLHCWVDLGFGCVVDLFAFCVFATVYDVWSLLMELFGLDFGLVLWNCLILIVLGCLFLCLTSVE